MKKAIISGICGMDASYLTELLLDKGYYVFGFCRKSKIYNFSNIEHLLSHKNFKISLGDLSDSEYISNIIKEEKPDKFFNLAAQSSVEASLNSPSSTFQDNTLGVLNVLDAIKNSSKHTKFIQASSSEMFGSNKDLDKFQRENTRFSPNSPYAISKSASFDLCKVYRDSHGLFACSSIFFNHTSPRRNDRFVEKKIINWICDNQSILYYHGRFKINDLPNDLKLTLGDIYSYRDFSHSKDCMEAMYLMSEMDNPKDYIVSSGKASSIKDILKYVFSKYGLDYRRFIKLDISLSRPTENKWSCGDPSLIKEELGWQIKYSLETILDEMIKDGIENRKT